jgi:hypothetical protein
VVPKSYNKNDAKIHREVKDALAEVKDVVKGYHRQLLCIFTNYSSCFATEDKLNSEALWGKAFSPKTTSVITHLSHLEHISNLLKPVLMG